MSFFNIILINFFALFGLKFFFIFSVSFANKFVDSYSDKLEAKGPSVQIAETLAWIKGFLGDKSKISFAYSYSKSNFLNTGSVISFATEDIWLKTFSKDFIDALAAYVFKVGRKQGMKNFIYLGPGKIDGKDVFIYFKVEEFAESLKKLEKGLVNHFAEMLESGKMNSTMNFLSTSKNFLRDSHKKFIQPKGFYLCDNKEDAMKCKADYEKILLSMAGCKGKKEDDISKVEIKFDYLLKK